MSESLKQRILNCYRNRGPMTQASCRQNMRYSRGTWDVRHHELVKEGQIVPVDTVHVRGQTMPVYGVGTRAIDRFLSRPARVA